MVQHDNTVDQKNTLQLAADKRDRIVMAAEYYWIQNMTVDAIAKRMSTSRSTISRLLHDARKQNIVEFSINKRINSVLDLSKHIEQHFHVKCIVVDTGGECDNDMKRTEVGEAAAALLWSTIDANSVLGVSWGRTAEAMSLQLVRKKIPGVQILQLHGFGSTLSSGENYYTRTLSRFGNAFDAQVHLLPAPAVFDSAQTRQMFWKETCIRQMLSLRKQLTIIVTSVGTPYGTTPSPLFSPGILSEQDLNEIKEKHIVGDVTSMFFRKDGSTQGISINTRSTGLTRDELLRVPTRIFIVADRNKDLAIRTALQAGLVTHLVIDKETANNLL